MINILLITITILLLFLYIKIEGKREGLYYYYKMLTTQYDLDRKEHSSFTTQRCAVLTVFYLFLITLVQYNIIESILFLAAIPMIFPFIHDNYYYFERHKLDNNVYSYRWDNQSTTSTAISDKKKLFGPRNRNILFIIGCGIFIYIITAELIKAI